MNKANGTAAGLIALLSACQVSAPPEQIYSADSAKPPLPLTARGQEPGWILRLKEGGLTLEYQYGEKQLTADTPPAERTAHGWRYQRRDVQQPFSIDISRDHCEDVMSGQPYPYTVTITLQDTTLHGCGGDTDYADTY